MSDNMVDSSIDDAEYGISPEDRKLLNRLRIDNPYSIVDCRESPTTNEGQLKVLARYLQDARDRGITLKISHEMLPIDSLTLKHITLNKEQIETLTPIYKKLRDDGENLPPAIVEVVAGAGGKKLILEDGHHRAYIMKYIFGEPEIYASVLRMGSQKHEANIGITYRELTKEDFIFSNF